MVVDASVIVAILNNEDDAERYKHFMDSHCDSGIVSPLTVYEATVSLARAKTVALSRKPTPDEIRVAARAVQAFLAANGISEVAVSSEIGHRAIEAAALYGKAVGHPADLNFGDCFAFAYAEALNLPLLYKGDDFSKTRIRAAIP